MYKHNCNGKSANDLQSQFNAQSADAQSSNAGVAVVQCAERRRAVVQCGRCSRPMRRAQTRSRPMRAPQSSNAQSADAQSSNAGVTVPSVIADDTDERSATQCRRRRTRTCAQSSDDTDEQAKHVPCAHGRPVRDVQRLFPAHSFPCPCDEQLPSLHARPCPVCLIAPIRQEKRDRHPMRYTRAHACLHFGSPVSLSVDISHVRPWASHGPPMPLPCPGDLAVQFARL